MSNLFALNQPLNKTQKWLLGIAGIIFVIIIWLILTTGDDPLVRPGILPHPMRVLTAYGDLYRDNFLVQNTFRSIGLNIAGYVVAIAIAIPVGMAVGLWGLFRGSFQPHIDAIRFVPLTAVTGLFIVWFGIGTSMKVYFLAFGILIYLLPVIVVRIDEVSNVYLQTVHTLGANAWQTIKTVYFPSVMSRISDDIRVLTAISWTYIIVAEGIGDQGGLGSLIFRTGQRMGRVDKTFAILILIMIFGVFQDRIFAYLDKTFFPHKYQVKNSYEAASYLKEVTYWDMISEYMIDAFTWICLSLYVVFAVNEWFPMFGNLKLFNYLFGDTAWVIHLIMILVIGFKLKNAFKKYVK
ncbi:MAG TPA: ABC transporter permease subunit [Saprospiraceae bacterium]|nr:ABC transporter permease subunit [Saprospiraceae bacterium]